MEHAAAAGRDQLISPRIIICADDFALSPGVSAAIASLARQAKIDAVSAMAALPGWARDAALLDDRAAGVEVGLHLVLCDERPMQPMPNSAPGGHLPDSAALTRSALFGRLDRAEFAAEIERQFDAFENVMGEPPKFVDGHRHCHLVPGLRDLVLDATRRRAPDAWLRHCGDRLLAILARPFRGKALGSALWSAGFQRAAKQRSLATNCSFAGHYDFRSDYAALLPRFLARPSAFHLVMCHPGGGNAGDPLGAARAAEYRVLLGGRGQNQDGSSDARDPSAWRSGPSHCA